jgi:hypothetical protein
MLAKLLEYSADLIDPQNPFGDVACGTRITLAEYLLPLDPNLSRYHDQDYMKLSKVTDLSESSHYNDGREIVSVMMDELEFSFPVEGDGDLVPILANDSPRPDSNKVCGLVLKNSSQPEGYRRIGYGGWDGEDEDLVRFRAMTQRLGAQCFDIY